MGKSGEMFIEEQQKQMAQQESHTTTQELTSVLREEDMVHVGVPHTIEPIETRYGGFSWLIKMENNQHYYFNSKVEHSVGKYFKIGTKCAFTCTTKKSKHGGRYFIINQIFYTF